MSMEMLGLESLSLEGLVLESTDAPCELLRQAQDMPDRTLDLDVLDEPFYITQDTRESLPPMTDETRERLTAQDYPPAVLDAIGSEAEAAIYENAKLEPAVINDKESLIRSDIDYDQPDFWGDTNLERMETGRPPLNEQGKIIHLHHIGQTQNAPLAELTQAEHCGNGNDNILHNKIKESEIDRGDFSKERTEYWKARAEQIKQSRAEDSV